MDVSLTGNERGRSTVTRFRNLATFLVRNEMNVYWISCRGKRNILEKKKTNSINDYIFHSRLRSIYPLILTLFVLFLLLKNYSLKIICYFPSLREGLPSLFINLLSFGRISYFIDYMDLSSKILSSKPEIRFLEVLLEKLIVSKAKRISVISPFLNHWVRSLGVSPSAIHIIPLCISDIKAINETNYPNSSSLESKLYHIEISNEIKKWIQQIKLEQNSYLIGYQGSIHPYQGLEPLIVAFSDKKLYSFYLLLAGGADSDTRYENKIRDLIIQTNNAYSIDKIKITGYLQSKDIQPIISLFDYGIVPKPSSILNEATFPSKCLRYLIEGIPIIATPSGWLKELSMNTGGILIEGYSVDSMIKAILTINEKRRLDDNHLKYIHTKFSTTRILSKWVRFLEL